MTLVWEHTVTSALKTALMSEDFPEPLCVGTEVKSSKGLPRRSWAYLPHNEKSEPMEKHELYK